MPKQKTALIASVCALVMILVFVLSFWLSSQGYGDAGSGIVLPDDTAGGAVVPSEIAGFADVNAGRIAHVTVTPQNVQNVIASLARPEAYSCAVSNTLYWGTDSSATLQSRRYVRQGADRIEQLDRSGAVTEVTLTYGDRLYAWQAGAHTYYSGAVGALTAQETAMLPTYETVCSLPPEQITEAGLVEKAGQLMIRVCTAQQGQTAEYTVSTETGLLYSAVFSENGVRKRAVQTSVLSLDPVPDSYFTLPDAQTPVFSQ